MLTVTASLSQAFESQLSLRNIPDCNVRLDLANHEEMAL
jgi:hypothetical protein